jgi:hypothetical protein
MGDAERKSPRQEDGKALSKRRQKKLAKLAGLASKVFSY